MMDRLECFGGFAGFVAEVKAKKEESK
jgi:hypothetical protein